MVALGYSDTFTEVALIVFCCEESYGKLGLDRELMRRYKALRNNYSPWGGGAGHGFGASGGDGGGGD